MGPINEAHEAVEVLLARNKAIRNGIQCQGQFV